MVREHQTAYIARGSIDKSGAYHCGEVSYIAVNFNFDRIHTTPERSLPFSTLCSDLNPYQFEQLFKNGLYYYNSDETGSQLICNGILCQIIGMLFNSYSISPVDRKSYKKLKAALDYLFENFHCADFKINTLAEISNISEKQFRRLFFSLYQKNPHEFLADLRLKKAKSLLLNSSMPISVIAAECGFSDLYAFSHCFKKNCGISPKTYREMVR